MPFESKHAGNIINKGNRVLKKHFDITDDAV